jgi:hypothetical protein
MNKKLYATCGILLTVLLIALVCSYIPFLKTNEGFEEGVTNGNTTSQGTTIVSQPLQGNTVVSPPLQGNTVVSPPLQGNTVVSPPLQWNTVVSPPLQRASGVRPYSLINNAKKLKTQANIKFTALSSENKIKFRNIIKDILANT